METAWAAITVTIAIFVLGHLFVTIWWASRVNVTLEFVQKNLTELVVQLKSMESIYAKKEDLIVINKSLEASWKKLDKIQEQINIGG